MVNRIAIKRDVRIRLQQAPGNAVMVCFLLFLLVTLPASLPNIMTNLNITLHNFRIDITLPTLSVLGGFVSYIWPYSLFVGAIIQFGAMGWFLCFARGESPETGRLFGAFRFYGTALGASLLRMLFVFLWTLAGIIPGFVKAYAYSMTEYILCENPDIPVWQAIQMSNRMTMGHKGELFELDLSFFGWFILNALTFDILGIFFVLPYYRTVHAQFYLTLKNAALRENKLTAAAFAGPTVGF